jgi:hypothetical protein
MIDPLLSLSFNLHAQKGTYALLLGSGLSRSASIPTGWEVTLDLVAKLAHLLGVECQGREADWYAEQFKREPSYSDILPRLAPTSAAQQQLLKAYFEPTEQEREEGKKLPTSAHKAIARLVATGHVRVIVTTNFDRLMGAHLFGHARLVSVRNGAGLSDACMTVGPDAQRTRRPRSAHARDRGGLGRMAQRPMAIQRARGWRWCR